MTEHTHPGYNQPMTPVQHPADGTPSPPISNATQLGSGTTEGGRVYFGDAASAYSDGHRDGTATAAARAAAHVPTAVAETLRYISQWGDDAREADGLRGVAADVDSLAKEPGGGICCPVCQEITCDEDCPLRTVRADLIGDSQ